jgi:hypothetical protein
MLNPFIFILIFLAIILPKTSAFAKDTQESDVQKVSAIQVIPDYEITKDYSIRQYLEKKGYRILSDERQVFDYILTKELLKSQFGVRIWSVQPFDPRPYIGQSIYGKKFIVTNHPLDKHSDEGKTVVHVLIVNGIPIGGTSLPYSKEVLLGGVFSLDGRTFESVQRIKNYTKEYDTWAEKWKEHFK